MVATFGRRCVLGGLLAAPLMLSAGAPAVRAQDGLRVVSTTGMVGDLAAGVLGGAGTAETLMGEGVDPHLYKMTRADLSRLVAADIVFFNGLLLEGKMTDALTRIGEAGKPVLPVTEQLAADYLLGSQDYPGQADPHVWMDVSAWLRALDVVRVGLAALRPDLAASFSANAAAYRTRLEALHGYVRRVLSSVPEDRRVLVTAHDAFRYFGRAYGFEVLGIQGISTESEAGIRRIGDLVETLVTRRIPAVFVESTVSERNVRALIDGAGARGYRVEIGGRLFSDAMGASGSYEGTYVGMIDHNVTTIARALGGDAPRRGFENRLAVD